MTERQARDRLAALLRREVAFGGPDQLRREEQSLDLADALLAAGVYAGLREALNGLRTPRNSLGNLAPPKGLMERAVEAAWDKATSSVGEPEEGIEMHNLAVLADAICDELNAALALTPGEG
jgi:hypothetical protein